MFWRFLHAIWPLWLPGYEWTWGNAYMAWQDKIGRESFPTSHRQHRRVLEGRAIRWHPPDA